LPLIDLGVGDPLVFVPVLEHLEFIYARQVRFFSQSRRVILYRRHESRTHFVSVEERIEELRHVLDACDIASTDFVAHGDAAMVLFEFALRYPERCRSLTIVAQGPDYRIAPHPLIWLLHEMFIRLPIERLVPVALLRRIVIDYITYTDPPLGAVQIPAHGSHGRHELPSRPMTMNCVLPSAQNSDALPPSLLSQQAIANITELPREFIEEQFCKIVLWPAIYRYSVLPVIHNFDIRARLAGLTMPILLINRPDDVLSPEAKTAWLAQHLPRCAGYHVVPARERFFLYSQAELVTPLIEEFLARV
jgi:pimeloyl-ACP methyl ester carboxylesterase